MKYEVIVVQKDVTRAQALEALLNGKTVQAGNLPAHCIKEEAFCFFDARSQGWCPLKARLLYRLTALLETPGQLNIVEVREVRRELSAEEAWVLLGRGGEVLVDTSKREHEQDYVIRMKEAVLSWRYVSGKTWSYLDEQIPYHPEHRLYQNGPPYTYRKHIV